MTASAQVGSAALLSGSEVNVYGDVGVYSSYVWRGFKLYDGTVLQTGVGSAFRGLSMDLWASNGLGHDEETASSELNYAIDYSLGLGLFSVSMGHTFYVFPPDASSTSEFHLGASLDIPGTPSVFWFRDYDEGAGNYFQVELEHTARLSEFLSASANAAFGINDGLFLDGTGQDLLIGLDLVISLFEGLELVPSINYSAVFGEMAEISEDMFFGGVALNFQF